MERLGHSPRGHTQWKTKQTLKKSPCRAFSTRSGSSYSLYHFQFFFTVNLCGLPGLSLRFFAVSSSSQLIPPKIKLLCRLFYFLMDGFLHHIYPLETLLYCKGVGIWWSSGSLESKSFYDSVISAVVNFTLSTWFMKKHKMTRLDIDVSVVRQITQN